MPSPCIQLLFCCLRYRLCVQDQGVNSLVDWLMYFLVTETLVASGQYIYCGS